MCEATPGWVRPIPSFTFAPKDFVIGHSELNQTIVSVNRQYASFNSFNENSKAPVFYLCSGAVDDTLAARFASYLGWIHEQEGGEPAWVPLYGNFSKIEFVEEPTLLILSGLTATSTSVKVEKCRDALIKWSHLPRIVVASGDDPISLGYRLNLIPNSFAYFGSNLLKSGGSEVV